MPVLSSSEPTTEPSHSYTSGLFSNLSTPHLFLGIIFFLCIITIFIRRRKRRSPEKQQYHFPPSRPSTPLLKKSAMDKFASSKDETEKETQPPSPFNFPSPPTIPPFPRPPPLTPPSSLSPPLYHRIPAPAPASSSPPDAPAPRRRSYTKPPNILTNTPSVTGEIISGDGWRRHTRVFGGGVCEACAESERGMSSSA